MTNKNAYAQSGVDVEAGYEVVERIKKHVARTERAGVMGALGGFGGMFDLSKTGVKEPVLISGTDGVGTKLMLAIKYDKHDTIGQDCVAMCVNDIIAAGAEPLYFLDYVATGKNEPAKLEQVVAGVAEGCVQAGAALIGGETAEMPGMYGEDDYDLAGFAVGVAEKSQIIDGSKVAEGDVLLGLASSGIHSNGYSLVRRVFADYTGEEVLPELEGNLDLLVSGGQYADSKRGLYVYKDHLIALAQRNTIVPAKDILYLVAVKQTIQQGIASHVNYTVEAYDKNFKKHVLSTLLGSKKTYDDDVNAFTYFVDQHYPEILVGADHAPEYQALKNAAGL